MRVPVQEAAKSLEQRGLIRRHRIDDSARIIGYVSEEIGRDLPDDLVDFYRERIDFIGSDFMAIAPIWSDWVGWRPGSIEVNALLHVNAVPIFWDGCGNLFGLDLSSGASVPAVYFFDHDHEFSKPEYAAGSSLGTFLLLLGEDDRAYAEGWPMGWELKIDPDIDRCPRARAVWNAG
jgi:hypothetical protein